MCSFSCIKREGNQNEQKEVEKYSYKTKGDNNSSADAEIIKDNNVLGKVIFKIPKAGYIQQFLVSKTGWIVAIVLPSLGIIIYDILQIFKKARNKLINNDDDEVKKRKKKLKEVLEDSEDNIDEIDNFSSGKENAESIIKDYTSNNNDVEIKAQENTQPDIIKESIEVKDEDEEEIELL